MSIRLSEYLNKINIMLTEEQERQFTRYYEMLVEWNRVMNLTAITDYEEVSKKHFLDSLAIKNVLDLNKTRSLIDIGTGAGFPGLPLKIVFPHLQVTLLDSLNKRIVFLNEVIRELGLSGIITIHGRAEDFAKKVDHREQYDVCVSRAVANLSVLSEYCIPYVKINGFFVSYKSGEIEKEINESLRAIDILGGRLDNVSKFVLPDTDIKRSFVIIRKIELTKKKYPRKAGQPTKEPL